MNFIKNIGLLTIFMITMMGYSQKALIEKGNKQYQLLAYSDAIKSYENAVEKGSTDPLVYKNLANSYYNNSQFENAAKYYKLLIDGNPEQEAEYYYKYAQSLKAQEKYKEASDVLDKFVQKNPTDTRAKLFASNQNFLDKIKENEGDYTLESTSVNTPNIEYGSFVANGKFYYTAYKEGKTNLDKWTNQTYSRIYVAPIDENKKMGTPEIVFPVSTADYNESNPVITKDGKTMYFTRNNEDKVKKVKSEKSYFLKIYKAELVDGKWTNIKQLPFNGVDFSTANPALSPDDKTLYFASNRPGTLGESDLYKASINDDGSYGEPISLGDKINTEGKENFPYVTPDNKLYFSSDGRPGLGGLDVFVADLKSNIVTNLGKGINSNHDDFAFLLDENGKNGFISSNRGSGTGFDDIYRFVQNKPKPKTISGRVYDITTNESITNATVTLVDDKGKVLETISSDKDGKYSFIVTDPKTYTIKAAADKYQPTEQNVIVRKENVKLDLGLLKKPLELGDDLTKILPLNPLYFDLNKWNIRPDAEIELAKVLAVLNQHPTVAIAIGSHTDSRASSDYNRDLSDKRAKATMNYLIKKGIDPNRLTAQGYGEDKLINKCSDGVKCTESEHQENRRSEFIVVKM